MPDLTNLGAHSPAEETERLDAVECVYAGKSETPHFGDWIRGNWAGETNPHRDGMYVKTVRRDGRCNPGIWYQLTDGKGATWEYLAKETTFLRRGGHAEIERLEKETARLRLALSKIARWYGEFPKVVDPEGKKCSYAAAYGSNGERDYMRMVAQDALSPATTERADK